MDPALSDPIPATLKWSRYYAVPSLGLWLFFFAVALIPPHNWNWRHLYHILPPVMIGLFFEFLSQVDIILSQGGAAFAYFIVSLAIAWETIWLLGPWIQQKNRVVTAILAWLVMLGVGAIAYLTYNGATISMDDDIVGVIIGWIALTFTIVASGFLSGLMQRKGDVPSGFLLWTLVFTPAVTAATCVIFFITMTAIFGGPRDAGEFVLEFLIGTTVFSAAVTFFFWIYNLPFFLLAIKSEKHCERLHTLFPPGKPERGKMDWQWKRGPAARAFPPPLNPPFQGSPGVAPVTPFGQGPGRINKFGRIVRDTTPPQPPNQPE